MQESWAGPARLREGPRKKRETARHYSSPEGEGFGPGFFGCAWAPGPKGLAGTTGLVTEERLKGGAAQSGDYPLPWALSASPRPNSFMASLLRNFANRANCTGSLQRRARVACTQVREVE